MIQVAAFEMNLKLTSNSIASEFVRKRCCLVRVGWVFNFNFLYSFFSLKFYACFLFRTHFTFGTNFLIYIFFLPLFN